MKTWWAMVVAAFAHATSDDLDAERLKGTDRRGGIKWALSFKDGELASVLWCRSLAPSSQSTARACISCRLRILEVGHRTDGWIQKREKKKHQRSEVGCASDRWAVSSQTQS